MCKEVLVSEELRIGEQHFPPGKPIIVVDEDYRLRLSRMQYHDYLQTEYWKRVKNWVEIFCNGHCQGCGVVSRVEIHHNNYGCRGRETRHDLIALCPDCHSKLHGKYKVPVQPPKQERKAMKKRHKRHTRWVNPSSKTWWKKAKSTTT